MAVPYRLAKVASSYNNYIKARRYSSPSANIFDRTVKRQQRNNIAALANRRDFEYLKDEVAKRLVDRLQDIERTFPLALDLGAGAGHIYKALCEDDERFGIQELLQCDLSEKLLLNSSASRIREDSLQTSYFAVDEEFLPFKKSHFDLIISSLNLHWVNDLPSTFTQIRDCLKPDGAFIGAVLGGDTLQELRSAFILADQERLGGISPHISPFMNVADAGNLLQGAGFSLCTVDTDYIQVDYPNALSLMEHLQGMGENNASVLKGRMTKDSLLATASIYQTMYGLEDGLVPATFQVIYLIGWAPHPSQNAPLRRGSAQKSLKEISTFHHEPKAP
uniref:Uncharacterized protein AlNc14C54G4171 n=1 Tax=Albugo laibachii Nc14 TaxID=890382 RepID=F0WBY4_9STRA|nr:conserved unknown protein putative [Albugo laibachii Nc14]|eukprot:CCA18665.1 conserved unknown protein putative [Albugo laibachii Nc14]